MGASRQWARLFFGLLWLLLAASGCRWPTAELPSTPTQAPTAQPPAMPATAPAASLPATVVPSAQPEEIPVVPGVATPAGPLEGERMTLIVVFDNNPSLALGAGPSDSRLQTGWGFAAWLEYGGRTVLFDTGADGVVLLNNMAALGLDPQAIDIVVLPHLRGLPSTWMARGQTSPQPGG
jgi:hypothetical protein